MMPLHQLLHSKSERYSVDAEMLKRVVSFLFTIPVLESNLFSSKLPQYYKSIVDRQLYGPAKPKP